MKKLKLICSILICTIYSLSLQAQNLAGKWDIIDSKEGPAIGTMILTSDGSINYDGMIGTWSQSGNHLSATVYGSKRLWDAGMPIGDISCDLSGNILQGTVYVYTNKTTYPMAARLQGSTEVVNSKLENQKNSTGATTANTKQKTNDVSTDSSSVRTSANTPQPKHELETDKCVLEGTGICRGGASTKTSGGTFYVMQPNQCGYRLYAKICIKTKSGKDDCGSDSIKPGGKTSYWHSSDDVTGQFSVTTVGVLKGGDDWSCMGKKLKLGSEN